MLLKIYELIKKIQSEIGNEAEVRFSARDEIIVLRVDWWNDDFHVINQYSEAEISKIADDNILIDHFIAYAKNFYARKKEHK